MDFHIDVVPGRFVDDKKKDTYLYQNGPDADKARLLTNLQTHIDHIKDSGYVDEVRLLKLWNSRTVLGMKTFVLELLAVKVFTDGKAKEGLSANLVYFWEKMRDEAETITVEDPANSGNDLSGVFDDAMRTQLKAAAKVALTHSKTDEGWKKIFGELETSGDDEKTASISSYAQKVTVTAQSWNPYRK